ncbi:heterokaryon incompatibility protein-domain-containing protein [Leptodontidium sp. MPI-SDFR-AT-0119]|nr:heterokaryon incompatibility protein-domain-containing protein [Leptodontidium sp. MPI-SDFR-AT-0119]
MCLDSPVMPDALVSKKHVVPWWEDRTTLELCHDLIRGDPPLAPGYQRPTRLLHLWDGLLDLESDIRLIDDTAHVKSYATLSHCWLQNPTDEPTRTLRANIEEHKRGISFRSLSRTFQQAVIVCRRLQIWHLWIDSLCIIQDDIEKADWERDGANMDNIYAGSSATIAMHYIPNGAPSIPYNSLTYRQGAETATIHVRRLPYKEDLSSNVAAAPMADSKNKIAVNEAWGRVSLRGWCYQERALSRRLFHLIPGEILIEQEGRIIYCQCTHHVSSEKTGFAGWLTSNALPTYAEDGRIMMRPDLAKYTWCNAVAQYTQRMLTYQSDLLPGLAGLARRLNRPKQNMDTYIAGLWGDLSSENLTLLRWLCWQSLPWESANPADRYCPYCRPRPRRRLPEPRDPTKPKAEPKLQPVPLTPSFSWASRFGPCEFIHDPWKSYEWIPTAELSRVVCDNKPGVPYGEVNGGFIDLVGTLYPMLHWSTSNWSRHELIAKNLCMTEFAYVLDLGFADRWKTKLLDKDDLENVKSCGLRYVIDAADDLPENGQVVYLLELFRNKIDETVIVLVLITDDSKDGMVEKLCLNDGKGNQKLQSYRRVGIVNFSPYSFVQLDSIPDVEIRLV